MRAGVRAAAVVLSTAVCLVCCVAGLLGSPMTALGESSPSVEGSGASSLLESPLVVLGSPVEGELLRAQEEAKLANPEVVAEREASRTRFEGLDAEEAARVVGEAFPAVVNDLAGGPPKLLAGESIAGFPTDNAAQIDLPEGKHGVIESSVPIAVGVSSSGQRVPVDLSLGEVGGVFEPMMPVVGVRIPKRLGDGVSLGSTGVSLTPVDGQGSPLGGSEGVIDGASVFFANTQTDSDTLVKAATFGFEADTLLRSVESPGQLSFRVGLPEGASLVGGEGESGAPRVVREGATVATIPIPSAQDAAGTLVPVSMSVSGDTLTLMVDHRSGRYEYPIAVDPFVNDKWETGSGKPSHWKFCASDDVNCEGHSSSKFRSVGWGGAGGLTDEPVSGYAANQWVSLSYQTQGESTIKELSGEVSESNPSGNIESVAQLVYSEKVEGTRPLSTPPQTSFTNPFFVCPQVGGEFVCAGELSKNTNLARYEQNTLGSGSSFADTLSKAEVEIIQKNGPTFSANTTSPTLSSGRQNVLYESGGWLSEHNGAFEITAKDPGIGISFFWINVGGWALPYEFLEKGECSGVQCPPAFASTFTYNSKMADGEYPALIQVKNATGTFGTGTEPTLKVDGTSPRNLAITGLPASGVINEAQYHLYAEATDGKAPARSSGIKRLEVRIDGFALAGGKAGACTPGPCTATGEWAINGEAFGAGKHTLTLVAEDYAGNVEEKEYSIAVRHAGSLPAGPGSVDPITGSLRLGMSDVSIGGGKGSLGVSRSYNSRQLTVGEQGSLGPQWSLNISGSRGVEQEPTGSVVLVGSDGGRTTFESDGKGGFISPKGDENLVLSAEKEGATIKAYMLKDPSAGTTVKYTQPGGAGPWVVASSEGALSSKNGEKEVVEWERLEGVTRPKLALAPAPAGVTCSPTVKDPKELKNGCRALSFAYATETTATGEAPSGWKAYKGRLEKVSFTAYNPSIKAMETKPVAEYSYDKRGRLRAEWDPRISPTLKMTYGYDAEGRVVAVNPPGVEPALLRYGTTASDPSAGRLLSVVHPPAGTPASLKEQNEKPAPVNTAVPTLSNTSPVIGTTLSISSNGSWSNSPLAYSDAWKDCYTYESKETCTVIPGAVNNTYTPQPSDAGYTLRAQVTAVNADGATVATTTASKALAGSAPAYLRKFGEKGAGEKQFNAPVAAAIDASGDVWVIDHNNNRVQEWSATGTWLHTYGKKGTGTLQFESPEGIAINQSTGNVYIADKGNNRIEELNSKGEYVGAFGEKGKEPGQLNTPLGVAIAPNGSVWVADNLNYRVAEFSETGAYLGSFGTKGSENGQFNGVDGIAFSGGNSYVVDPVNDRVQEFSMSGQYIAKFGSKGTGNGQFETPYGIATEPVSGDLYVADSVNHRIEEFNPAGTFLVAFGKKGEGNGEFSSPQAIAVNPAGYAYVADTANNRVQELEPTYVVNTAAPEPPVLGTSTVMTIDYGVPVSGSGAPHEMTKAELEKWGQKDEPTEATAIFPPDEPMGWPAKDYKRATITYLDELGRTVNRASPSGGISTSEYNETNEVIRSLSADNRAIALTEGAKSKETSELIDTKSKYNGETTAEKEKEEKEKGFSEAGTRLLETTGPEHKIRLAGSTTEKQARNHIRYFYNEGAPVGETYNLMTKAIDSAKYEGSDHEERTTTTSYSGQENLGWLLREPTSVTTDAMGLKLVHKTFYSSQTGKVIETQGPAAGSGNLLAGAYAYSSQLTTAGSNPVLMSKPGGVAVDSEGHVWVADTEGNRVDEFSSTGEYITRFGVEGAGNGQFKKPQGIAVDSEGHVWVADTGNNRLQELTSKGVFIKMVGSEGTETGKFKKPTALAFDSSGNVWVADTENNRLQEFSSTGIYLQQIIEVPKPLGVAVDTKNDVWVTRTESNVMFEYTPAGKLVGLLSLKENKAPTGIAISGEAMYVADSGNNRIQEYRLKKATETGEGLIGEYLGQFGTAGTGNGQFKEPQRMAIDKEGHLWVADAGNNRVQEFSATGEYIRQLTTAGGNPVLMSKPGGVAVDSEGHVWVADTEGNRVDEFSSTGEYITRFGVEGAGNGQFKKPQGIAVDSEGHVWVADTGNNRLQEFTSKGVFMKVVGSEGTETGKFKKPTALAFDSSGNVWVADTENYRLQEFSSTGIYLQKIIVLPKPLGVAVDAKNDVWVTRTESSGMLGYTSAGKSVGLFPLKEDTAPTGIAISGETMYVADSGNNHIQEYKLKKATETEESLTGEYVGQFGTTGTGNGQFKEPQRMTIDKEDHLWVADAGNNRVQEFAPTPPGQHATQTIYYSATENETYAACGKHPEWAELPCQSQPAVQPGTTELPNLPIVTDTYNMWDEPETVTENFEKLGAYGATTRTKKLAYDSAGRLLTNEETSTIGTSLPKVTDKYSSETGAMVEQSTTVGETTKTIKSEYNTLGQLTEYTDTDGNTTQYVYAGPANDGQVEEVNYGGKKGSQMYSYDPTTMALTKLLDLGLEGSAGAGTFTAVYDVEGKMTSETYPNGMTAKYTFNPASEATGIEYEKTTHCTEKCVWFSEVIASSIHGEPFARTSTLAKEEYTYDNAGRLTKVNETPTGKGCKTRIYGYNEDSDRTSQTTRESATETCATSGGTTENHTYDTADRLTDTGVEYEALGNQTKIPENDAEKHPITANFYVDNQVASQKQNGETINYSYDPAGRTEKTISEGTTNSTVINHYPGPGEAVSWTSEEEGKKWVRNVPGIDGSLCATQKSGEAAVLQLHDLQGNIIAEAALSETETKLVKTYNPTEFGVPVNGTPPKYSWLGASGLTTELPSGATASGGTSYVPQLGAPLQTQPIVPPGAFPNGSYTGGPYATQMESWVAQSDAAWAAGGQGREADRQAAAKKRQEEEEAQWRADHYVLPPGTTPEPGEGGAEGEEAPSICELAVITNQEAEGCGGGTLVEGGGASVASGPHCGTFTYAVHGTRKLGHGKYRITVSFSVNFNPGYIPAYWQLTLSVDGQFYQKSGGGGTVDIESFGVTVSAAFTITVPKRFPLSFIFVAETVDGALCQVSREHPDVEV